MALNALEEQRLKAIGLDDFLALKLAVYKQMAKDAYAYTATTLTPTHQIVRQDDVSGHLEAQIQLDDPLKVHLLNAKKSQQYWVKYFTHLILDQLWEELESEYQAEQQQAGQP